MSSTYKWLVVVFAVVGAVFVWMQRELLSHIEEPRHTVVKHDGAFEIRHYEPVVAAETTVASDDRRAAANQAFDGLFGYISGENSTETAIPMTAPVATGGGERIAMTAPVTQAEAHGGWRVRFFLPASYTPDTAPTPTNPAIELVEIPARRVVAVRFSGSASEESLEEPLARLETYVAQNGLETNGDPVLAQYNSPFVLSFLRRNEFIWPLESSPDTSASREDGSPDRAAWTR